MNDFPWLTLLIAAAARRGAVVALLPDGASAALAKQVALGFSLRHAGAGRRRSRSQLRRRRRGIPVHRDPRLDQGVRCATTRSASTASRWCWSLLTALLMPVVHPRRLARRRHGRWSTNALLRLMLVLEALAIGVFAATDVFLFYVLFEAMLIPMYFLIGGFGGAAALVRRGEVPALLLVGGLLMLAAVVGLYVVSARRRATPTYLLIRS